MSRKIEGPVCSHKRFPKRSQNDCDKCAVQGYKDWMDRVFGQHQPYWLKVSIPEETVEVDLEESLKQLDEIDRILDC